MNELPSYPKVLALGKKELINLYTHDVEVTEKIDGSQFGFMLTQNRDLVMRSKGGVIYHSGAGGYIREVKTGDMFSPACDYVMHLWSDGLLDQFVGYKFYCETLSKPHHGTLTYERTPFNHLYLYGAIDYEDSSVEYNRLKDMAEYLNIEAPKLRYSGGWSTLMQKQFIEDLPLWVSQLGGEVEGFVVKANATMQLTSDIYVPITSGKYVTEKFKEVRMTEWSKENTGKGKFEVLVDSYRTEARWEKAVQHLRDEGKLLNDPKDIGGLIKEISNDIKEEEKEVIKEELWKIFGKDVVRKSTAGFPEWYKKRIAFGE